MIGTAAIGYVALRKRSDISLSCIWPACVGLMVHCRARLSRATTSGPLCLCSSSPPTCAGLVVVVAGLLGVG